MLSKPKSLISFTITNGGQHLILGISPELGGMRVSLGGIGCSGFKGSGGLDNPPFYNKEEHQTGTTIPPKN